MKRSYLTLSSCLLIGLSSWAQVQAQERRIDLPLGSDDSERTNNERVNQDRLYTAKVPPGQPFQTGFLALGKGSVLSLRRIPARVGGIEGFALSATRFSVMGLPAKSLTLNDKGQLNIDLRDQKDLTIKGVQKSRTGALLFKAIDGRDIKILLNGTIIFAGRRRGRSKDLRMLIEWPPSLERFTQALFGAQFDPKKAKTISGEDFGSLNWEGSSEFIGSSNSGLSSLGRSSRNPSRSSTNSIGIVGALGNSGVTHSNSERGRSLSTSPSLEEAVAKGTVLGRNDRGNTVKELQSRLNKLGYSNPQNGVLDATTENALKKFQRAHNLMGDGLAGPNTMKALKRAESGMPPNSASTRAASPNANPRSTSNTQPSSAPSHVSSPNARNSATSPETAPAPPSTVVTDIGRRLAAEARRVATRRNTIGSCYAGVADAVDFVIEKFLYGSSAYMAADQLKRHQRFRELSGVHGAALRKLPAGAIVVWKKTARSPYGHISVALGDGREASDHVAAQLLSLRGDAYPRVFIPKK
ncbi:MAG: hypothetical protein HOH94_12675 [Verrucomicrobia bacterium]|jgi:hypothetical protein|nr:hypothetical protein [Verrucomicrobiota bacterium]